jgi:diguanylate cyclase (GGDEF)-like protein/PAS domain S-box-containing protein
LNEFSVQLRTFYEMFQDVEVNKHPSTQDSLVSLLTQHVEFTADAVLLVRDGSSMTVEWRNAAASRLFGAQTESVVELFGDSVVPTLALCEGTFRKVTVASALGGATTGELRAERVSGGVIAVTFRVVGASSADAQLRESESRFRALADRAPIGILAAAHGLRLYYANARAAEILGVSKGDLVDGSWLDYVHPDDVRMAQEAVERLLVEEVEVELPLRVLRPTGATRWVTTRLSPVPGSGFVASLEDVSETRELHARLAHQASHDHLTGLPNRRRLGDVISVALRDPELAASGTGALLFIDLDHFKVVNDTLGHRTGDDLLVEIARRLSAACAEFDTVSRFGGDEFVVFAPFADATVAHELGERILRAVSEPVELLGTLHRISASIGLVAIGPQHVDAEVLLRDADIAMYQAKEAGRATVAEFDEKARSKVLTKAELKQDLEYALERNDLTVVYQPIVAFDGTWRAADALIRWSHPERGVVAPAEFIPLAEEMGLIDEVFSIALDRALGDLARWRRSADQAPEYVAVNVWSRQLRNPGLLAQISAGLARHDIDPGSLCIEITESMLLADPEQALGALRELKDLGVLLAFDDFGTGYSSMAYLHRLPVDIVKIDKAFVGNLGEDASSSAIVGAMILLSHALSLVVVADGVDTSDQVAELSEAGCDLAQGTFFARPQSIEELISAAPVLSV